MAGNAALKKSPLAHDRLEALAAAVHGLSVPELSWASGYLAGLAGAFSAAGDATPAPVTEPADTVTILYGSQTGNGRHVAAALEKAVAARRLPARLVNMADFKPTQIRREKTLLIVVSTHGDGDPPEDAEALHEFLAAGRAPRLEGLGYAVLALGDSSYAHFCRTGRDFDERLEALGANRLRTRVDCDVDFDKTADAWIADLVDEVSARVAVPAEPVVRLHSVPDAPAYDRRRPFDAELLVNQRITAPRSDWQVHHLELSLEGSGLRYRPGDSIGIVPVNPPDTVAELMATLGLDADERVEVGTDTLPLADALGRSLEITGLSRAFVERYAALAGAQALGRKLKTDAPAALADWMRTRHVLDVVRAFTCRPSAQGFVDTLRRLTPRLYSIASGPTANPDEVHLTVAALRFDAHGRRHEGAASTFLADRVAPGDSVPVFVEPNDRFRLPVDPDAPVIMIGPGTGVAPFRAFVEERAALGCRGRNWLVFGARRFENDFLYQLEWLRHRRDGMLTRLDVAFSRDQADKVYVQHRLREQARALFGWLEEGAHLYVCGDADAMATDVHAALVDIVREQGAMSDDAAASYLDALKAARRYQRDVY